MEETRPFVSWDLVHDFMVDVFVKYGVPEEDARICTDVLLESDRRGIESHGCNRFKPIYLDRIKNGTLLPKTEIEIVKDTPCTVAVSYTHLDVYKRQFKKSDYRRISWLSYRGFFCGI